MKNFLLSLLLIAVTALSLPAEQNRSVESVDGNHTDGHSSTKMNRIEAQVREQMEREKKYAKEQRFYQGSDYNLSSHEVDPASLSSVPVIEPDYDFDIDDVYNDAPDL